MADTTDIGGIAVKGLLVKWFAIFMTGGLIYYFLEIAVRHYSHYSMILCGGMATLLCGGLNQTFKRMSVLLQMVISAVIVSELEFITGYIFNIGLNCGIWDYSDVSLNLMLIAPAMIYVDDNIRCNLFGEERPVYRFW